MRALTWSLLHFLWQGAAIAALAAAVMSLFRASTTRYLIGIGALALMFVSFGVTFALLSETPARDISGGPALEMSMAADYSRNNADVARTSPSPAFVSPSIDLSATAERDFAWVARGWLAGVCLLALRIAFGLLLLEQLRRRNLSALPVEIVERCRALQQRLGISRLVRYCECRLVTVPSVIGFFRPIVLLPMRALTGLSTEQLEAVIAHELGHVKRFDVAVNFFQVIAETLFFFHPAVWWLNKRIRADREDCCDDVAIAACGRNVSYARALATMEEWRDAPEFAMAATGSDVATRVARLLGISQQKSGARSAGVFTASLVLMAALMAGAVSIGIANPALASPPSGEDVPLAAQVPAPVRVAQAPAPAAVPKPAAAARPAAVPKPAAKPKPAAAPNPPNPSTPATPARGGSFIAQMKSAGFDNLDVDQLVALKVQDVTPEYVRSLRAAGLEPDVDEVIAMKVHDVTPEYVEKARALGFKPDLDEVIAMKVHDVTPEYIEKARSMGFKPDLDEVIAMKVHDVTPQYVEQIRAMGFKPSLDEVVAMKVHGITPEFVKSMRDMGMNPDAEEIIALKVHEVTPEFRQQIEATGYKLTAEELIEAKVMDVTPEFIQEVRSHGFKDLTMEQIIQLKNAEVL